MFITFRLSFDSASILTEDSTVHGKKTLLALERPSIISEKIVVDYRFHTYQRYLSLRFLWNRFREYVWPLLFWLIYFEIFFFYPIHVFLLFIYWCVRHQAMPKFCVSQFQFLFYFFVYRMIFKCEDIQLSLRSERVNIFVVLKNVSNTMVVIWFHTFVSPVMQYSWHLWLLLQTYPDYKLKVLKAKDLFEMSEFFFILNFE